jgi:hypothetical protein
MHNKVAMNQILMIEIEGHTGEKIVIRLVLQTEYVFSTGVP